MGGLGLPELIIIGIILLLLFGGKKLPELGAGLGKSIKEFKQAFKSEEPKDPKQNKS
jgi:sec-independent protein translocase protein TatA